MTCGRSCSGMRATGARGWWMRGFRLLPGTLRSSRSCWATRSWRRAWRRSWDGGECMWRGFFFPSCRRAGAHPHADECAADAGRSGFSLWRPSARQARRWGAGMSTRDEGAGEGQGGAGAVDGTPPGAGDRPDDVLNPHPQDGHLRDRTSTSGTGTNGRRGRFPCLWSPGHEFAGEIVEIRAQCRGAGDRQRCSGEVPPDRAAVAAVARGQVPSGPATRGIGVNEQGAFAEYRACPPSNGCRCPMPSTTRSGRSSIRWATRCIRRCPSIWWGRMCCVITGAGPIGIMARRRGAACWGRACGDHDVNPHGWTLRRRWRM